MIGLFTTARMATTALVGIERLVDPSEFGANLVNARAGPTHGRVVGDCGKRPGTPGVSSTESVGRLPGS